MIGHMAERLWRQFQVHLIHLSRMKNSILLVRKSEGSNPSVFIYFAFHSSDHYDHLLWLLLDDFLFWCWYRRWLLKHGSSCRLVYCRCAYCGNDGLVYARTTLSSRFDVAWVGCSLTCNIHFVGYSRRKKDHIQTIVFCVMSFFIFY